MFQIKIFHTKNIFVPQVEYFCALNDAGLTCCEIARKQIQFKSAYLQYVCCCKDELAMTDGRNGLLRRIELLHNVNHFVVQGQVLGCSASRDVESIIVIHLHRIKIGREDEIVARLLCVGLQGLPPHVERTRKKPDQTHVAKMPPTIPGN